MHKRQNLFYSKKEGFLFFIPGYVDIENVEQFTKLLDNHATYIAELAGVPKKEVRSFCVSKSSWCKDMRVFYVETKVIPADAVCLNKSTMAESVNG